MNVIIYVTTFIIMISLMTYAKYESFLTVTDTKIELHRYLKNIKTNYNNERHNKWYKEITFDSNQSRTSPKQPNETISKISWETFVNLDKRNQNLSHHEKIFALSKELIYTIYKDIPYFQELLEIRPNIVEELLFAIEQQAPMLKNKDKISDLVKIDLKEEILKDFFYFIEKGYLNNAASLSHITDDVGDEVEKEDLQEDNNKTRITLFNYISLKNGKKIRVYLASEKVLLALFQSPNIVKDIINYRNDLFKQLIKAKDDNSDLKKQLQLDFEQRFKDGSKWTDLLNFDISKTDPSLYE
ncbi:hypothetical protein BN1013_00272 [Candidatus Rubidus massiliensis]|nr:hypothetical protein BN1013_00272 [Candidatus Rubidus massiliensis]